MEASTGVICRDHNEGSIRHIILSEQALKDRRAEWRYANL